MSYQQGNYQGYGTIYPPPPGYPSAPPQAPPPPYGYPYPGYQGYPPPPQYSHCDHHDHDGGSGCTSFLQGCLAALCCCCVLEECCF